MRQAWLVAVILGLMAHVGQAQTDVVYARVDGQPLVLDVYRAEGDTLRPAIVRISPRREKPAGPALALQKQYTLVYASYLTADAQKTGKVFNQFPQDVHVAKAALRHVHANATAWNVDGDRIALWGAGHGATVAAIAAMTNDMATFDGNLGDYVGKASSRAVAVCLVGGTTDFRNAELYGDETVNVPGSPGYQLFGANIKDASDAARRASALQYVRPTSMPVLMITLSNDPNRAMHLIFAETLKRAGVASALYEQPPAEIGKPIDETKMEQTIVAFFGDVLSQVRKTEQISVEQEIERLANAGLYKQARRLVEEQLAGTSEKDMWRRQLIALANRQQEPAIARLLDVQKDKSLIAGFGGARVFWTIREVLTDPERIGQYEVEPSLTNAEFAARAEALGRVQRMNQLLRESGVKNAGAAESFGASLGHTTPGLVKPFMDRWKLLAAESTRLTTLAGRRYAWAQAVGEDLYGPWLQIRIGGQMVQFRYIAPPTDGKTRIGSQKNEWGRLPNEPLRDEVTIAKGFWISEHEVTQAMYEGVLGKGENRSTFKDGSLPVHDVSYAHAVNFCEKVGLGARLPTIAEHEYATRAGSIEPIGGTGRLADHAVFWDEQRPRSAATQKTDDVRVVFELQTEEGVEGRRPAAVKSKLPNAWGLYDMQGNVWELCQPRGGAGLDKATDPPIIRGGSWLSIPQSCRAARTAVIGVEERAWHIGFRIVLPAE